MDGEVGDWVKYDMAGLVGKEQGMKMYEAVGIAWFLWSTVYPIGGFYEKDIKTQPIKQFVSQAACEKARYIYKKEIDKAFPPQQYVELKCSPVYPR